MSIMTDMQIIFVALLIITFGSPVLIVMLMKKAKMNKSAAINTEKEKE
ncbi:hypothetical protein [Sulfuricurvum sp.]|nr:hypothetical protein [Sulfuricurvum sp.]HZF71400.1 hypothetical protein [Sulfuricurvum sp.]